MSTTSESPHQVRHVSHHFSTANQEFDACRMGMWLFLLTELMLFGAFFVGYVVFRNWFPETFAAGAAHLDYRMGAINSVILIVSSMTMAMSIRALQRSKRNEALFWLLSTVACGAGFLIVKYMEYHHKFELGIFPGKYYCFQGDHLSNESVYFSLYYVMTGTHALHVIIGMSIITWAAYGTARGKFYSGYYTPPEMVALYWYLVELIWVFLYPLLYLMK